MQGQLPDAAPTAEAGHDGEGGRSRDQLLQLQCLDAAVGLQDMTVGKLQDGSQKTSEMSTMARKSQADDSSSSSSSTKLPGSAWVSDRASDS